MILIGSPDEIRALVTPSLETQPILLRAQESGPCVHYDPHLFDPCTYPYDDGRCPHLDDPAILCPVKDACSAMQEIAGMREACEERDREIEVEADQVPRSDYVLAPQEPPAAADEPDVAPGDDPAPVPAEGRRTPRGRCWTPEEDTVLRTAASAVSAQVAYRESFPDSGRTPAAVSSRWYKVRSPAPTPTPDFAGDTVPVTQCEEEQPTESRGLYGDARAPHADMMDGAMCDAPLSQETEEDYVQAERVWEIGIIPEALPAPKGGALSAGSDTIRPGDRVALLSDLDRVGEVAYVSPGGVSASVQFPGGGPARVFAIGDLRRVV